MIVEGKPQTEGDTALLADAPIERQGQVLEFIKVFISPSPYVSNKHTSYTLKHRFAEWIGENEKLSNNQFKDAMLISGYEPVDPSQLNWKYKINVENISDDVDRLQRFLLPEHNILLKRFILRHLPQVESSLKNNANKSYRYSYFPLLWVASRNTNQIVVKIRDEQGSWQVMKLPFIKGAYRNGR